MLELIKSIFSKKKKVEEVKEEVKAPEVKSEATPEIKKDPQEDIDKINKALRERASKTRAHALITSAGGSFFTVNFIKKNGESRVMNCQYLKGQKISVLGYVKVKETKLMRTDPENAIREINLQTVKSLKIKGVTYTIN